MSEHREIELKRLLVGEGAGEKLVAALSGRVARDRVQVNHLFDTANYALRRARYALRLRTEGRKAFLTAKGPTRSVGRSTGSKVEAEAAISMPLAKRVLTGRVDPLAALRARLRNPAYARLWRAFERAVGDRAPRHVGHFENRRRTVRARLPSGLRIAVEIDRTYFPGGRVDHEVEIELPSEAAVAEAERWLRARLRQAGVAARKSTPKVARFYASRRRAG